MKEIAEFIKANRIFILILVLLSATVYFGILFNGFVSADDLDGYVNNLSLYDFWLTAKSLTIYPIIYSLFKITVGNNAAVIHLYSLILHVVNTVLVLIFVNQIFGKKIAAISSILFAVHPINTEAIAWLGGNSYLLNAIFIFPILILYSLFRKSGKIKYFIASVTAFVISLAITRSVWLLVIPFIIGILEIFMYEKKINLKSIIRVSVYFIPGLIFFFLINALAYRTMQLQTSFGFDYTNITPWLNRLPYSFYMGTKLLIFPKDLSIFHESEIISLWLYRFMIFVTLAILGTIFFLMKRHRIIAGLLMLIIVSVSPALSPIQVAFFIAERYLYVGSVFFTILLAMLFLKLETKTKIKSLSIILTVVLCIIYSVRTFYRTQDWKNSLTLWTATAKIAYNSPRVYNNIGDAYASENNYEASINAFKYAIKLQPNYAEAFHNLGNVYLKLGQYQLAKENFEKALEINPNYGGAQMAKEILKVLQEKNL